MLSRSRWREELGPILTPRWIALTPTGGVIILACFLVGMLAIVFTNNLFYFLVAMLLGFVTVSGILSEWTIRGLRVRRHVPGDTHALSPVFVTIEVENLKRSFPSLCLLVKDESLGGEAFVLSAPPGETVRQRFQTRFPKRGLHPLGRLRVSTTFPFGFFRKYSVFDEPGSFIVLPPVHDLTVPIHSEARGSSEFHRAFRGEGTNLFTIREYRSGDSSRLIHWRSTARMMKLMIKELESEVSGRVTVELAGGYGARLETAVTLAASILNHLDQRDIRFRLRTASEQTRFESGRRHLAVVLQMLALYEDAPLALSEHPTKEELILTVVSPGADVPPGRRCVEAGEDWDWLVREAPDGRYRMLRTT